MILRLFLIIILLKLKGVKFLEIMQNTEEEGIKERLLKIFGEIETYKKG